MSTEYYKGNTEPKTYPFFFEDNTCFRYTDKEKNADERNIISNYWREQINLYGQKIGYIVNNTSTLSADMLYGEQPTQRYSPPRDIVIAINLNENALLLSKFGLVSDDEVTAFVHISSFYSVFGYGAEPKSGDLFQLTEYGNDRPGGRNGNIYEVTQRLDQDIAQINPLAGHYVWLIKAKRFEYSFEPGVSQEAKNDQIYDDTLSHLDMVSGFNFIPAFPGFNEIPFNKYDSLLFSVCLCSVSTQGAPVCYRPGISFNPITKFIPGEGTYIVSALTAFQIQLTPVDKNLTIEQADKPYNFDVGVQAKQIFDYGKTDYGNVYGGYQ